METLEGRQLLASIAVSTLADSGVGSLRQAIADATAGDTIDLTSLSGTINLGSELTINNDLIIEGPGADQLALDGQSASRIINQLSGSLTVRDLTLQNGYAPYGGAWSATGGNATAERMEFVSNDATSYGGAIHSNGFLTIRTSTFYDNNSGSYGGGIFTFGTLNVYNSTFTQNSAANIGGAIFAMDG